jgi:copper chaperone NosL
MKAKKKHNMELKKTFNFLLVTFLFVSCTVSPEKIEYGVDGCSFCKMTIVETKFASEIVTQKGRASKYDAIECMLNDLKDMEENTLKYILVTDYTKPRKLIDATMATYLINKEIKSPMGKFLSAYASKEEALFNGTALYNWKAIKKQFSK